MSVTRLIYAIRALSGTPTRTGALEMGLPPSRLRLLARPSRLGSPSPGLGPASTLASLARVAVDRDRPGLPPGL